MKEILRVFIGDIDFSAELTEIIKLFYRDQEFEMLQESPTDKETGLFLYGGFKRPAESSRAPGQRQSPYVIRLRYGGREVRYEIPLKNGLPVRHDLKGRREFKREVRRGIYSLLSEHTGKKLPWGMLTGIRPAKIVHELLDEGLDKSGIGDRLRGYYRISPSKAELVYEAAMAERAVLDATPADSVSLYIGIPFCATRCLYCSFASNTAGRAPGLLDRYVEALKREIVLTARLLDEKELKLQNIYIGGGTPTVLETADLKDLLDFVEGQFRINSGGQFSNSRGQFSTGREGRFFKNELREYTLEAGRPDSLDREKLQAIRESAVNRISINPQAMNDATLKLIGRNHTAEDIVRVFGLARDCGFDNINMDVIMGLPGEDGGLFENTLRQIRALGPESLTVHALAVKRASGLSAEPGRFRPVPDEEADAMMETALRYAREMGLHPYYLYRQKNISGNLENTGFCKPGCESLYNIQIMEERQSIIAVGAGAVTKVVYPEENRIERAFNVKNVEEYIRRTDEMFERKNVLISRKQ